jgi:hypothetical protein
METEGFRRRLNRDRPELRGWVTTNNVLTRHSREWSEGTVPTLTGRVMVVLVVLSHQRRRMVGRSRCGSSTTRPVTSTKVCASAGVARRRAARG